VAVEVGKLAPPADVRCLVRDAGHGCLEAPAVGVDYKFFGRFRGRYGQGGDQRADGAFAFIGEAVQGSL
jgi:hypothetical protein